MISIHSVVSKIRIVTGEHFRTKPGPTYTFINDLVKTSAQLPRMIDKDVIAILRHKKDKSTVDYQYRPSKVWSALQWLKLNNHLYKNIQLEFPEGIEWETNNERLDIPFIEMSDEDVAELTDELNSSIATTTIGSMVNIELQQENELFLFAKNEMSTQEDDIRQILNPNSLITVTQSCDRQFTSPYQDPNFFWAKSFPWLYPYGYGCPSDPHTKIRDLAEYAKHMMQRGGGPDGRRFQKCPNFYFSVYHYESRRKVGGIAYEAKNEHLDTVDPILTADKLRQVMSQVESDDQHNSEETVAESSSFNNTTSVNNNNTNAATSFDETIPTEMTKEEFNRCVNRMSVYGKSLPGTPLHMKNERNNLMSMLQAPTVQADGIWRWFITFSPADIYEPRLFEILLGNKENDHLDWSERIVEAAKLSKEERIEQLQNHPALAARLFHLKQKCIWDYIINGKDKPLGEMVDFFRRIEFQMRGSPHMHALISICKKDGITEKDVESDNSDIQEKVKHLITNTVLAILVPKPTREEIVRQRNEILSSFDQNLQPKLSVEYDESIEYDETTYDFNSGLDYFPDFSHPCREQFPSEWNFKRHRDGTFADTRVQERYRQIQLASQMHQCRKSCYKYCKSYAPKICRYNFPYQENSPITSRTECVISSYHDSKKRRKVRALPPRNNGHLNNTFVSPLLTIGHGGNHDLKYISNTIGAAEYSASYTSKQEKPDFKLISNFLYKKLTYCETDFERLKAVGKSLLDSMVFGSVEVMYNLLGLPLVTKSRTVENFNPLPREMMKKPLELNPDILDEMSPDQEPVKNGIYSNLGKRDAYFALMSSQRNQYNTCYITLYALLTNYTMTYTNDNIKSHSQLTEAPLLEIDEAGQVMNTCANSQRFRINNILFRRRKQNAVINLCPYIPADKTDETSCYATLLLHVPWPIEGESLILCNEPSAVCRLKHLFDTKNMPEYLPSFYERLKRSEELFQNTGTTSTDDNHDDAYLSDNDDNNDDQNLYDESDAANSESVPISEVKIY